MSIFRKFAAAFTTFLLCCPALSAALAEGVPARAATAGEVPAPNPGAMLDFNGTWQATRADAALRPNEDVANLTDTARARRDNYLNNFVAKGVETGSVCYAAGMPWMMLSIARTYVYDIYQSADRIFVTYEPMDQFRTIYLDGRAFPDELYPSRNGYSIGHFEGDVLKIETRGLNPTNEKAAFQLRGGDTMLYEEWRIVPDQEFGKILDITVTMDDPEIYRTPGKGHNILRPAVPGAAPSGYNCPETLWDDLVEKMSVNTTHAARTATESANADLLRCWYETVLAPLNPDPVGQFLASDFVQHSKLAQPGPEGVKTFIRQMQTQWTRPKLTIINIFADGDFVIGYVHQERFSGDPGLNITNIYRVENGRLKEHWGVLQPVTGNPLTN